MTLTKEQKISKVKELWSEFKALEATIQSGLLEEKRIETINRYVQLLGLFFPITRTADWCSPLEDVDGDVENHREVPTV